MGNMKGKTIMTSLNECCLNFGGDEIDNTYRMLFGHHPFCPRLEEVQGLLKKADFDKSLNHFYQFWKKTELDKIRNEFYASDEVKNFSPSMAWKRIKSEKDLPTDSKNYLWQLVDGGFIYGKYSKRTNRVREFDSPLDYSLTRFVAWMEIKAFGEGK